MTARAAEIHIDGQIHQEYHHAEALGSQGENGKLHLPAHNITLVSSASAGSIKTSHHQGDFLLDSLSIAL